MTHPEPHHVSIRDLQRNAAAVLGRVERGESYVITRHGRTVGRLLPPDAADEAIESAVADGILDARALSRAPTAAALARTPRERAGRGRSVSDALAELRAEER